MKKIYLAAVLAAAISVTNNINAQHRFSLSVMGTPQFSFLQNETDNNNRTLDRKATFNAAFGVGGAYHFTTKAGIGLDVLYSLQGQRYENAGKEVYQKQDYVKIPLYFLYNTDPSRPVSFVGKIGPQISLLAKSRTSDFNGNNINRDTKDWYKSASFGSMAGAGAQFRLSHNLHLTTMARFDYDFTNAENSGHSNWAAARAKTHNMTTGLEVGLRFGHK